MIARVTKNEMVCPVLRAAADTVPPIKPITSGGQHHAPMIAGMERSSVKNEQQRARLVAFFFS